MTVVALILTGWAAGAALPLAIVAAGTRKPTPQPVRPLDDPADLARVA